MGNPSQHPAFAGYARPAQRCHCQRWGGGCGPGQIGPGSVPWFPIGITSTTRDGLGPGRHMKVPGMSTSEVLMVSCLDHKQRCNTTYISPGVPFAHLKHSVLCSAARPCAKPATNSSLDGSFWPARPRRRDTVFIPTIIPDSFEFSPT